MKNKAKIFNYGLITPTTAEIRIYGDIVADKSYKWSEDDYCPSDLMDELAALGGKDLIIHVNSCGGNVFAGYAMYNALQRYKQKYNSRITAEVDALAASIASVVIMAADEIIMPENSYLMIHPPYAAATGNAAELRETADMLDRLNEGIVDIYADRTAEGVDRDQIVRLMDAETWLAAKEAAATFKGITTAAAVDIAAKVKDSGTANRLPPEISAAVTAKTREEIIRICIAGIVKGE